MECLKNTEFLFIPSKIHCDMYYICQNGVPFLKQCPSGLHWNQELEACDFIQRANCPITKTTTITTGAITNFDCNLKVEELL